MMTVVRGDRNPIGNKKGKNRVVPSGKKQSRALRFSVCRNIHINI